VETPETGRHIQPLNIQGRQQSIMKLPALVLLLLVLLLPVAASAVSGTALQPARTVAVVTVTTTPAPALSLVPVRVTTVAPAALTCTAPAACMSEEDAIAKWGSGNFAKDADQSCGSQSSRATEAVLLYCYRQTVQASGAVTTPARENDRSGSELPPTVAAVTGTPLPETTTHPTGTPAPVFTKVQAPAAVTTGAALQVTTPAPAPEPTAAPSGKQSSIVDAVFSFFASIFRGGKSSGSATPPGGGNMEPTPQLPGGMQPVTQVTTPKGQSPMNTAITVTSPAAGVQYTTKDKIPVKWVKPNNPAGTVNLRLVSRGTSPQTVWASAVVPNTGSFDWYQQDLAHDCGVGNNQDCWGGMNPDSMGVTFPIQYQNAWNLPAYHDVAVEVSTDAMDPYPAFSGSSGTFTIVNPHAFIPTKLEDAEYFKPGDYPAQISGGPVQTTPWVGYRNSQNGNDPALHHEMWRTIIIPDFSSGFSVGDKVKKATLILKLTTDKGTGNGVTPGTHDVKDWSAVTHAWFLMNPHTGYPQKSQLAVIADYDLPATPGSTAHATFDAAAGTVTVDVTDPVNQWFTKASSHTIVLVGPDESGADTAGFYYSTIDEVTLIVEKS
jgi:hypothetical protein